ncbi:MAG: aminoglycoside phosphotransferase family protein [Clostridia bacterium]|nr:aminoglycoside phosphotransferase family protein [Clostridia bacterium]
MDIWKILSEIGVRNVKDIKELYGGLRCLSYLLMSDAGNSVLQIYTDDSRFQARKKAYIYDIVNKSKVSYLPIPKVIQVGEKEKYCYIIINYYDGEMISEVYNKENSIINQIAEDLVQILSAIHSLDIGNCYGWLGDEELPETQNLEEYLYRELERFNDSLIEELNAEDLEKAMNIGKEAVRIILKKVKRKPVLTWYDINPKNILVENINGRYSISGFIDSGAARFGVLEWDFAFIKVNFCKEDNEFENILNKYIETGNAIDLDVLNAFIKIVELDDLALQIRDKKVYDIPRNSTFEYVLIDLKNKYGK